MSRLQRDEAGQAMIEFALMAPFLILMLCGVVYCGGLMIMQESLAVTARHVARSDALDATRTALKSNRGGRGSAGARSRALHQATSASDITIKGVNWGAMSSSGRAKLHEVDAYTAVLVAKLPEPIDIGNGKTAPGGVGVVFHGVTLKKDLSRDLSPVGRLASMMAGGLRWLTGGDLAASSVMPAEMPPKGEGPIGVLNTNTWISRIVKEDEGVR